VPARRVEHQQQLAAGQVVGEQIQGVAGYRQRHPEHASEAGDDQGGGLVRRTGLVPTNDTNTAPSR
jgi:hypothetical protein